MRIDFDEFDAILLDLDGTIYHEEHALPGAVALIQRLQREKRRYACLTNSTSSPTLLTERLGRMGVVVDSGHIYTAAAAAADYVLEKIPAPARVFNLSTEGVVTMLEGKVQWVNSAEDACDAVICGVPLNPYATEERTRAALVLLRRGARLVAICADRVYPSPRGLEFGVGAMAAYLSYASGATPIFCGKPERFFFEELCQRLGAAPARCLLIGDNLESDVAGAKGVGMRTVLTLTGVATRADVDKLTPVDRPDWIIESLESLVI